MMPDTNCPTPNVLSPKQDSDTVLSPPSCLPTLPGVTAMHCMSAGYCQQPSLPKH